MEALAHEVHKQLEHIATFHTISTATYVGMVVRNVAMLQNVFSLFVYFVSQCLHLAIHTFLFRETEMLFLHYAKHYISSAHAPQFNHCIIA